MVNRIGVEVMGERLRHPRVTWPPKVETRPAVDPIEIRDDEEEESDDGE